MQDFSSSGILDLYQLIGTGNLVIPKISSPAHMLFNYLLSHEENYPIKVLHMMTPHHEPEDKYLPQVSMLF